VSDLANYAKLVISISLDYECTKFGFRIVAAICWGLGQPVTVEEIQVDPPKATEVRVKMLCSSLCHTDITSLQGFPHVRVSSIPCLSLILFFFFL